jgi:hypothetical protein
VLGFELPVDKTFLGGISNSGPCARWAIALQLAIVNDTINPVFIKLIFWVGSHT